MKVAFPISVVTVVAFLSLASCQKAPNFSPDLENTSALQSEPLGHEHDEEPAKELPFVEELGCIQPTAQQRDPVNLGNEKKAEFLSLCLKQTGNSPWCHQLVRPNPSSKKVFRCTYGPNQAHQLIHPNERTWKHAIRGVQLVKELAKKGIRTCQIYNWWRPEPYNKNVGGAAGRHPFGTSIDVRLCSDREAIRAFDELCKLRKKGHIRAIGYYGSSSLHFGVGDKTANTWGRSCK